MSDTSSAYPPPPPPSVPPPTFGAPPPPVYTPPPINLPPGYKLPPGYQGPVAPDYAQPYQGYPQPYAQYPQPVNPGAVLMGGSGMILSQFGGAAAASIVCGLVSIIAPFAIGFYFPILPIAGILNGVRAITRGRLIGGVIGLVLSAIGGVVSLFASGLIGG